MDDLSASECLLKLDRLLVGQLVLQSSLHRSLAVQNCGLVLLCESATRRLLCH